MYTALWELNGDKALRVDGFTIAFWQISWTVMKEEVMRMLKE